MAVLQNRFSTFYVNHLRGCHLVSVLLQPSFGYIITSPEKRDPFALIRPSDVSSRDASILSNTIEPNQQDQTLNAGLWSTKRWTVYPSLICGYFGLFSIGLYLNSN